MSVTVVTSIRGKSRSVVSETSESLDSRYRDLVALRSDQAILNNTHEVRVERN